jgi:superfamily II DNA or RNA helicase
MAEYFIYLVIQSVHDQQKLGMTMYPISRMRTYLTGDAVGFEKQYAGIWQFNCKNKDDLHSVEKFLQNKFITKRQFRRDGSSTEWFKHLSVLELETAIKTIPSFVRSLTIGEITEIHKKAKQLGNKEEDNSDDLLSKQFNSETLFAKFCRTFLPNKIPRRIQTELWSLFHEISVQPEHQTYRGIVQWPTGTGKTIATLMLIVLAKERCVQRETIYRGLFVSPKNDILDTISKDFNKLSEFGITVYDGSHGKLSGLTVPTNTHILVYACQAALTMNEGMARLPPITHCHYDEVHRITGDEYFKLLKDHLLKWNTEFLTGTSATPETGSSSQKQKLSELFGEELNIIHKCDVDEAVQEGWIAKPRFLVDILKSSDSRDVQLNSLLSAVGTRIQQRKDSNLWHGGKIICFVPGSIRDTRYCIEHATKIVPDCTVYGAVDGYRTDGAFIAAPCDGTVRILFACERFREGSDVKGLEMTAVLTGDTIAAYLLLQISGRALRNDYDGKEGWSMIVRPSEEGTTEDDVYDSVLLNIIDFLSKSNKYESKEIERLVRMYFNVHRIGKGSNVEETVKRLQSLFVRRECMTRTHKEKYALIRDLNKELNLKSKREYEDSKLKHLNFISDPDLYFKEHWTCWYEFLGIDISLFPQTKAEWKEEVKKLGICSREDYEKLHIHNLPLYPEQMYEDYTNWNLEFNTRKPLFKRLV